VIGAGPAGATIARRLAALGHDVVLIERAAFPRPHIGESLPPSICPVLDLCGVREQVEAAGFLRPASAIVQWSGPAARHSRFDGAPGFQVDRGRFDHLLLAAARDAGASVRQPARAGRPVATADGWAVPLEWQ
jgi:flavin-dependent dehydrogenase